MNNKVQKKNILFGKLRCILICRTFHKCLVNYIYQTATLPLTQNQYILVDLLHKKNLCKISIYRKNR